MREEGILAGEAQPRARALRLRSPQATLRLRDPASFWLCDGWTTACSLSRPAGSSATPSRMRSP